MRSVFDQASVLLVTFALPCVGEGINLGECISGIYTWSLTVVGLVAFVQILWAGWIWLTAFGNTSKTGAARTKITNAILGMILLFSSYLILRTINPDLVGGTINLPKITRTEQIKDQFTTNTLTRIENFDVQPRVASLGSDTTMSVTLKIFASDKGVEQACWAADGQHKISSYTDIRSRFKVYAVHSGISTVFQEGFAEHFGESGKVQSFDFSEKISKAGLSGGNAVVYFKAAFTCDNGGPSILMNESGIVEVVVSP